MVCNTLLHVFASPHGWSWSPPVWVSDHDGLAVTAVAARRPDVCRRWGWNFEGL